MKELIDAWGSVGLAGFIVLVLAYVLLWHLIPHWKAKDVREQEFKHRQSERIQEREDGILKEVASLIRQNVTQSEKMTDRMDVLTQEIRDEARDKRRR